MLSTISVPHDTITMEVKNVPDLLFHTTLIVVDYQKDPSGSTRYMFVIGTNNNLTGAKSFCMSSLKCLGFDQEKFAEYKVRPDINTTTGCSRDHRKPDINTTTGCSRDYRKPHLIKIHTNKDRG
jgi:hypothetical protein